MAQHCACNDNPPFLYDESGNKCQIHPMTPTPKESWLERLRKLVALSPLIDGDKVLPHLESFIATEMALSEQRGRDMAVDYITSTVPAYDEKYETPRMYIDRPELEALLEAARHNKPQV